MWDTFEPQAMSDETVTNAFCTNGLFKVTKSETSTRNPNITAIVQNQRMMLAIEQNLYLIENENITECRLLSFDAPIDCVALSESGNLFLACLSDGSIHGIHVSGMPLFNIGVKREDVIEEGGTFVGVFATGDLFFLSTRAGMVYRISNMDEKVLAESMTLNDESNATLVMNETLMSNVLIERCWRSDASRGSIDAFMVVQLEWGEVFVMAAGSRLRFCQGEGEEVICLPKRFDGVRQIFNLDHFLLGLTNSGQLIEICPFTKAVFVCQSLEEEFLIDELIVLANTEEEIELLLLSKATKDGDRLIKIVNFPSMKCKNELPLPKDVRLVQQAKSAMSMYYVEAFSNEAGFVQSLEMKCISETEPADRLRKLIRSDRLLEAEEFAQQFELSFQPIYEAKARKMCMEICYQANVVDLKEKFAALYELLQKIENRAFLAGIASFEFADRGLMAEFLRFLLQRLDKKEDASLVEEINEKLLRLDTLKLIDPTARNGDWRTFINHKDLLKVCMERFKNDIGAVCLIWSRHSASIVPYVDLTQIMLLLGAIPSNIEPFKMILFFRHFVPNLLLNRPELMSPLVEWSIQRTKALEFSPLWPDIGLEFAENLLDIFKEVKFLYPNHRFQYEAVLDRLQALTTTLKELAHLKSSYNLILPFNIYQKDSLEDVAFHLLQRVQSNNFIRLVDDFLRPLFLERGLLPEPAIIRYIEYLSLNPFLTDWHERAVTAVQMLSGERQKLKSALLVLQAAPVPWSDLLTPLIALGKGDDPTAREIFVEYKLQAIKIVKRKYGWPLDHMDREGDRMLLVRRIVKINSPEMEADLRVLVKAAPEIKQNAYFYVVFALARRVEVPRAVRFLAEVEEEAAVLRECYRRIISAGINALDAGEEAEESILELVKTLNARLEDNGEDKTIRDVEKICLMRRKFGLSARLADLWNKKKVLGDGCDAILRHLKSKGTFKDIFTNLRLLCDLVGVDLYQGAAEMTDRSDLTLIAALIGAILATDPVNARNCHWAFELAKKALVQAVNGEFNATNTIIFPLLYRLVFECLRIDVSNYPEATEFFKWTIVGRQMFSAETIEEKMANLYDDANFKALFKPTDPHTSHERSHKRESMSLFERSLVEDAEMPEVSTEDAILEAETFVIVLKLVVLQLADQPSELFRGLKYSLPVEESLENLQNEFFANIDQLLRSKSCRFLFLLIQNVRRVQGEHLILSVTTIDLIYLKILKRILSVAKANLSEALNVLLAHSTPLECLRQLEMQMKTDRQRIAHFALLELFHKTQGNVADRESAHKSRVQYQYHAELCKIDASMKFRGSCEFISVSQLMADLRGHALDVSLLRRLAVDFAWDYQELLAAQIMAILAHQELAFDLRTDVFGMEEVQMRGDVDEIVRRCWPYLSEVTQREMLAERLIGQLSRLNAYFYEVYLAVIRLLRHLQAQIDERFLLWEHILHFLKFQMTLRRRIKTRQYEHELWLESQADNGMLPTIAKFRVPFYPLVGESTATPSGGGERKRWKRVLDDEVCVENAERWLPLVRMLAALHGDDALVEQEYLCMSAVKNSIADFKSGAEESTVMWHMSPVKNGFLETILRLVRHVGAKHKVAFILYYVTNNAPEGADQVEAARETFNFVVENEEELLNHPKARDIVLKIKRKYPIFKIQHLLHLHGLAEERFFQLVESPDELINALYHHESILTNNRRLEINKMAQEIAELYDMDFETTQWSLLQKWLGFSPNETKEETFLESSDPPMLDEDAVQRANYVLSSWDHEKAVGYLVSMLFEPELDNANTVKLLQLVECFHKLVPDTEAAAYEDIIKSDFYCVLKCVHHLRQLGVKISTERFRAADKLDVLKQIWRSHPEGARALETVVCICVGFEIWASPVWNGVLKQMVRSTTMTEQLGALVPILSAKKELLATEGMVLAWQAVIMAPLRVAGRNRTTEEEAALVKSLLLLQACPLTSRLNLDEIAAGFLRLQAPHMAAVLLAFVEDKRGLVKMILGGVTDVAALKTDLAELEELGVLPSIAQASLHALDTANKN